MSKYKNDYQLLANTFAALSNPNRLKLFLRLASCCSSGASCKSASTDEYRACIGELGEGLDIAPSTLSHHIKELRTAGLISVRRNGKMIECQVATGIMTELSKLFLHPERALKQKRRNNQMETL